MMRYTNRDILTHTGCYQRPNPTLRNSRKIVAPPPCLWLRWLHLWTRTQQPNLRLIIVVPNACFVLALPSPATWPFRFTLQVLRLWPVRWPSVDLVFHDVWPQLHNALKQSLANGTYALVIILAQIHWFFFSTWIESAPFQLISLENEDKQLLLCSQ